MSQDLEVEDTALEAHKETPPVVEIPVKTTTETTSPQDRLAAMRKRLVEQK